MKVREAIAILHTAAALALQSRGEVLQSPVGRLSYARWVPRGVVGVISPFNFPLILSIRAVAPAVATGNAVVLKPDAQTRSNKDRKAPVPYKVFSSSTPLRPEGWLRASQAQLDTVARKLNTRPRETLGWKTPAYTLELSVSTIH
jgi:hypothetical protein